MRLVLSLLFFGMLHACNDGHPALAKMKVLKDYPSGSAIAYFNDKVYLMGDDASYLMIMDDSLNQVDTITIFNSAFRRIPKDIKEDPEAAAIVTINKKPMLLIVGSGSSPLRNNCRIINMLTKEIITISLDTFYNRVKAAGIKDLNIEGITEIPGAVVLACRGNKSYPKNHLVFATPGFWKDPANADFHIATIGNNADTSFFKGISGLEYSTKTDRLLLSVSTENTYSSLADGTVGNSYLWIVNDVTTKKNYSGINPNKVTDLTKIDSRFALQKIESVCIISENKKKADLLFVSDDDKGGSVLFKVVDYNW